MTTWKQFGFKYHQERWCSLLHHWKKKLNCPEYVALLYEPADDKDINYGFSSLTKCKACEHLLIPSPSVFKVVKVTERLARAELESWATITENTIKRFVCKTLLETKGSVFCSLEQHSVETHVLEADLWDDHVAFLIESLTEMHIKVIFHRFSRIYTDQIIRQSRASRRQRLTKQILFHNAWC